MELEYFIEAVYNPSYADRKLDDMWLRLLVCKRNGVVSAVRKEHEDTWFLVPLEKGTLTILEDLELLGVTDVFMVSSSDKE